MKGSVGTSTYIISTYRPKKKYKKKKGAYFCVACRGWVTAGQWFTYTSRGTTKHAYKNDCKKVRR